MTNNPSDTDDQTHRPGAAGARPRDWGPLEIRERLGTDSAFDLYRARHTVLGRDVALRLFDTRDPDEQQQLLEAGRKMMRVRHPNVVQVLGADVHDGVVGIWSELIAGETLGDVLEQLGPLSSDETITIGRQLAAAVATIHDAGLFCRGLYPANVLREKEGGIRLDYFGSGTDQTRSATDLSAGGSADSRTDIQALGVLLYRLATGMYPPPGDGGFIPEPMIACLDRAVAEKPADRFQSATDFGKALAKVAKRPVSRVRRIAGITIILALAVLVILQWPSQYRLETTLYRVGDDGSLTRLVAGEPIGRGECLALELETTVPMFVYVFSEDAAGKAVARYPQANSDAENPLAPDVLHNVAATRGDSRCWPVDRAGEFARLHILASPEPVPDFRALYLALPQAGISESFVKPLEELARELDESADAAIGVTYTILEFDNRESAL